MGNFLSFNSIQEFSMIGGKVQSNAHHINNEHGVKLLKFGALFGANASGKSNLIKAMNFAHSIILDGLDSSYSNSYFRLDAENKIKPSYFEFEIKIKEKFYAYGFEILLHTNELTSEWLHEISSNSNIVIFERDLLKKTYHSELKLKTSMKKKMDVYSDDLKSQSDTLFINEMNRNKDELYKEQSNLNTIRDVFRWFRINLDINYPDRPVSTYSYFYNEMDADKICKIIKAFGTGITNYKIVNTSMDEATENFPKELTKQLEKDINEMILNRKNNRDDIYKSISLRVNDNIFIVSVHDESFELEVKTVVFEHGKKGTLFKFSEESDGTRRILDLVEILMSDHGERVYVIDEIDRSLHPQLTYKFIDTFLALSKHRKNQLIVTTHESRLLDFNLLRRDEIWFVDKNNHGESSIYSLEAYNERFDKKIDKAYLDGRYGGVPIFSSIFPVKEELGCE